MTKSKADTGMSKKSDPDKECKIRLINCWPTKQGYRIPALNGEATKYVVDPFGVTVELPSWLAERMLKSSEPQPSGSRRRWGWNRPIWREIPESGDCKDQQSFVDKNSGQVIQTCRFGQCPRPGHTENGIHHSINQAQRLIGVMPHAEAIRSFVMTWDHRPAVASFGMRVATYREDELTKAALGLPVKNAGII